MDKTTQDNPLAGLVAEFPRLFRGQVPGRSDLDPGWVDIVRRALRRIDAMLPDEQAAKVNVAQVKEKWGELRLYVFAFDLDRATQERIAGFVKEATAESQMTCAKCGEPGELRTDFPHVQTLCDTHAAERGEPPVRRRPPQGEPS
jgi:hypothetical protein